ncbi:MAG: type II and III secretion system protein, partial [Candidatus Omnitrophica bacterium]|nr:type II and III secretion system protein [Candidatus Omnitrophota bacterium]
VVIDEATGTVLLIDIPEKLEVLEKTIKGLDEPLVTKIFDLGYMNSTDAKTQLSALLTPGTGELFVDERSHKAIVSDLPGNMRTIERAAKAYDEEAREVTLAVEMVELTLNDEYQSQINWEKVLAQKSWDGLDIKGVFPVASSFTPQVSLAQDNMEVTVGTLSKDRYASTLQFLSTLGDVKIISRQTVAAVSNTEAKVKFIDKEPFTTQAINGTHATTIISDQIEFFDVGVTLSIIPIINKDGIITMKISPNLSSVRETIVTEYSIIPILEKTEAFTSIAVKSGQTAMMAGMQYREFRKQISGIPGLAKNPLFGTRTTQNKTKEVIIFVTPFVS